MHACTYIHIVCVCTYNGSHSLDSFPLRLVLSHTEHRSQQNSLNYTGLHPEMFTSPDQLNVRYRNLIKAPVSIIIIILIIAMDEGRLGLMRVQVLHIPCSIVQYVMRVEVKSRLDAPMVLYLMQRVATHHGLCCC
jgi:hypothetical protein